MVRRGAKLLHAFGESVVPRITLITRKSYGGAYIAMNSRSLGATRVFAWPTAEVAVMGAVAAVRILHRRKLSEVHPDLRPQVELELAAEHEIVAGGLDRAMDIGVVDEVVQPSATRRALAGAIIAALQLRGGLRQHPAVAAAGSGAAAHGVVHETVRSQWRRAPARAWPRARRHAATCRYDGSPARFGPRAGRPRAVSAGGPAPNSWPGSPRRGSWRPTLRCWPSW